MIIVRGDGVGIEVAESFVRAVRLRHDVAGRVAAAVEFPIVAHDDNAALDAFVLLRAELGEPHEPTRLATFPTSAALQRIDVTGRSGPELNKLRARLDRRYGINSTLIIDDGPRRWMLLITWDATAIRRLEDLAERAGFVDVTIEPSPLALARVVPSSTRYVRRLVAQADAHHGVLSNGLPVAATGTTATGRPFPDIDVSDVEVPLAWFDELLGDAQLSELIARVASSAQAHDVLSVACDDHDDDDDDDDDAVGQLAAPASLGVAGEGYPTFPVHDIRSGERQGVALGAAAGAAGLAGALGSVDMIVPAVAGNVRFDAPWAVERLSDLPETESTAPTGGLKRMTRRLRPRRRR